MKSKQNFRPDGPAQLRGDVLWQVSSLSQELTSLQLERDRLQSEQTSSSAQEEQLLRSVTALTEERDQLQEILEGVREEKRRLREELEEQMEMVSQKLCLNLHMLQVQILVFRLVFIYCRDETNAFLFQKMIFINYI